jgi:hypothetical protein
MASPASAALVTWDVDPSQSSFKLTIPDQPVSIGTVNGTMRLRNQNNAAWTTNTAPVDGLLATDVGAGVSSIEFLGGSSSLFGVNTGNYRPNPAAYSTAATNASNTDGTFTNTSSAAAVFAARVNATVSILTINIGYIAFSNVLYDLDSGVIPITGTSFASNVVDLGILNSDIALDSVNSGTSGIGDTIGQSGSIYATNSAGPAGAIVDLGGGNYRLTVPINMPVFVDLSGVQLNATATGTVVAYAFIPEPTTIGLLATGIAGLAAYGRRRRQS